MDFEWNEKKASSNLSKHGVSFEEASEAFDDPFALIFEDESHSESEDREQILGYSHRNRLILLSFTQRGDIIRIISARIAVALERKKYEAHQR